MKTTAIAICALVFATSAFADDHLEPEYSIVGGQEWSQNYDNIIVGVLHEAYERDVIARMVTIPSFQAESAVGIRKKGDRYTIFVLSPATHLWGYQILADMQNQRDAKGNPAPDIKGAAELSKEIPADWHDVKVNHCEVDIDAGLSQKLSDVWGKMLMQTRYPAPSDTVGVDGVIFHFYSYGKAGQIWSPSGGQTRALVDIAETMSAYCVDKKNSTLISLTNKANKLSEDLATSK